MDHASHDLAHRSLGFIQNPHTASWLVRWLWNTIVVIAIVGWDFKWLWLGTTHFVASQQYTFMDRAFEDCAWRTQKLPVHIGMANSDSDAQRSQDGGDCGQGLAMFCGVLMPKMLVDPFFEEDLPLFQTRHDDVFVASFPKSGKEELAPRSLPLLHSRRVLKTMSRFRLTCSNWGSTLLQQIEL